MRRSLFALAMMALAFPATAGAVTFSSDATVTNHDYGTEQVTVLNRATVTFDNVHFGPYNANGGYEGRLQITQGAHAIVKNSKFGPGGCSDGIQLTSGGSTWPDGVLTSINNEFVGLRQGSCGPHVDAIQFYGGHADRIEDNYVHDVSTGIVGFDSNGQIDVFKNNVLIGDEYQAVLLATSNRNGSFTHNVVLGRQLRMDPGHGNSAPTGNTIRDNVADDIVIVGGSNNTVTNNLDSSQVTFVGGSGRCAYALASPKGTATDGTDIGLNNCGGPPPPPPPTDTDGDGVPDSTDQCPTVPGPAPTGCPAPPPDDNQPTASFTASPEPSAPGQQVTFNGSASTCEDTPCTYTWVDDGPDGLGGAQWPLGTGSTLGFTFQGAGTKYVRLTVVDVDGDSDTVEHDHVVSNAPPPPPPSVQLLGRNSITGTVGDSNTAGRAQAYQYTATASGGAVHVRVYVDSGNTATSLRAGIYNGTSIPTTLRAQGSTSSLTGGQWADVTIPSTSLTSGTRYWIAILGAGGTLRYRDGNSPGGGLSYGSRQSNLTSLPATWSNGSNWSGSWALSAYVTT